MSTWDTLTDAERFALVKTIVEKRSSEFRRRFANVVSVGVGYRTRNSKPTKEICLRILVSKKWSTKAARSNAIPSHVRTVSVLKDHRVVIDIPTDVAVLGRGKPHAGINLTRGLMAKGPECRSGLNGAACCLVHDSATGDRYLMGCHHVFAGSSAPGSTCARLPDMAIINEDTQGTIADTAYVAPLISGNRGYGIDAALAFVLPADIEQVHLWGTFPVQVADDSTVPSSYRIYAPKRTGRTAPLKARFLSIQYGLSLRYRCGIVRIVRAIESEAATEPGDSGSPLIGADGTLYGMHFYETDAGQALAILATDLFAAGVFPIDITLA